jgi:hypothetical protein
VRLSAGIRPYFAFCRDRQTGVKALHRVVPLVRPEHLDHVGSLPVRWRPPVVRRARVGHVIRLKHVIAVATPSSRTMDSACSKRGQLA